ncbi:nucleoside triphosphate pyrophosphohydrolase [Metabacillus elymi]|uniref:Nucleoside triphosphate pyrophosphohydrolase n=1 Tax=Metabacillus elymi TaxID=2745198 RepID=A0ABX6S7H0_9BACI|nr:nucleoside triphosphate pyrophosphohydrolase [Metabacillus sp. KUDC1714]QNF29959.1 nucleoside triphosphate pyrophosphohydrolase [Metabacillus sp. KUDC1714]
MPVYNKLVRDKIPEIIEKTGKKYMTKILSNEEYIKELQTKGFEELTEYVEAKDKESSLEELADVLEIIHALAEYHGSSINQIEEIRKKKAVERGGFKEKIYLVEVDDE